MSEQQIVASKPESTRPEWDRVGPLQTRLGSPVSEFVYSPDDFYYWRQRPIVLSGGPHWS